MNVYERLRMLHRLVRYRWRAERSELRYVLSRPYRGGSVLDIGAHRGVYSYWLHRQFNCGTRVVAFEPQPELIEHLRQFKKAFHLERFEVAPVALSSQAGTLAMHRPVQHWGAATVAKPTFDREATEVFDVPVSTIDTFLANRSDLRPVRFIKCDVEYHEAEVLASAERTLQDDRPELLVEWSTERSESRERLFALMQRLGYTIFQFEYGRLVPCTSAQRHAPPSWQLGSNYVFLPREAIASAAA